MSAPSSTPPPANPEPQRLGDDPSGRPGGDVPAHRDAQNEEPAAGTMSFTASSDRIEPDSWSDDVDDGYAGSTNTSYLTSIASDIRRGIVENGRTYSAYGLHKAWIPSDDMEMERNDLQHCKFTMLMNDKLHLAPMIENPHNILDLGTGSGIWAIDMAELHPSARVIGVDTSPTQPVVVPPNLTFEIDDIEDDWLWGESSFDLIHGRELIMAIRDWPRLVEQAYSHLKPGAYLQLAGSVPDFRSDDDTLPRDSAYVELGNIYLEMSERVNLSGWEPTRWKQHLEAAGFEDVVERILKIPTCPWPKDPRLKQIGAFELQHFRDNIANVFARGYEQILNGDPVYFQVLLARARQEVLNQSIHSWVPFYVVYGRRPNGPISLPTPADPKPATPETN